MNNKEMFYFTGQCLVLDENPGFKEALIEKIDTDSIDWIKFAAICSNHLILPAIYIKFKTHDILRHLPEEFSEYLKEIYDLNLSRNNKIMEQLHELTNILNRNNIYPIFLKGAAHLLDELYSDIGERILGDIDFLVPEKDYFSTAKLLGNDGYSIYKDGSYYFDFDSLKHYPPMAKPGSPAYIEIHRLLTNDELNWFNGQMIEQEKKEIGTLQGCYVLSDKHKIIHNFVHGQLQHEGHLNGIVSFRDIYDLYLLSKRCDLEQTLPFIKCKQKAIAYFACTGKAFGLKERFYSSNNFSARLFSKKHDLNLGSPIFYHTYRGIVFCYERIFIKYFGQIVKSFYSKSVRHSLVNRLSDPKWYGTHLKTYVAFFIQSKK